VNTAAVERPELLTEIAGRFGSQCTVLAIDAAQSESGWEVVVNGGRRRTGIDVTSWARDATTLSAGEILLTSWDRDGTRTGYDLDLIAAVTSTVSVPVIASGGADNSRHLEEALRSGASAVLIASILHDGETTVATLKSELLAAGQEVRP
jgi:imidazoleglycerol phosphate synthase cyclase subunit